MLFEKVTKEHILLAIKDFEEKGFPKGFGHSSTYDLIYENEKFPPMAIMAYANFHATNRKIEPYFKGGKDTDCFKAFERNNFKIVKKTAMDNNLYQLKEEFLNVWPLERLNNLSLEEYTDTKRENSFCYWLEHKTRDLGSIVGGSSYKFGIYKIGGTSKTEAATNRDNDGVYAWHTKYGETAIKAFEKIKSLIIQISELAIDNNLNQIDTIDLGDAFKWKIAFLYSNYGVINIFKKEALRFVAKSKFKEQPIPAEYGDLNAFMLSKKGDQDFYTFTKMLWQHYDKNNSKAVEFKKWLNDLNKGKSNKSSSYISAIKILITEFNIEVYTEQDINVLQDLYEDLILHQKDENGKYAYVKKSYGVKGFYSAAIKEYIQFLKNETFSVVSEPKNNYEKAIKEQLNMSPLNQILYGPPGTGKTYNTINKAIAIVNPDFDLSLDRESVKMEYDRLVNEGKIVFTTFHQSMAYEDFVEGIKPVIVDSEENSLNYAIEKGIFKQIVDKSKGISGSVKGDTVIDFSKPDYYKMSLGGKNRKNIHDWCIDNDLIALGWGGNEDYSAYLEIKDWTLFRDKFKKEFPNLLEDSKYHIQAMYTFQKMKQGDIVLASLGNHILDAIGVVEGEYKYDSENEFGFHHTRKVKWLATNLNSSPDLFIDKKISQQSIYEFYKQDVKVEAFKEYFSTTPKVNSKSNYVLIIDEINRGNVSAIFGELITLIEESKRLGNKESLEILLPYSKESFGVPNNLYIIGTMNTADRSVEALDTALRRRFVFEEMLPDTQILEGESIDDISLSEVLKTINNRIEALLDRDHTIGHSYLLGVMSKKDLANTFNNKIIPLLQEYFYGDYGKIGLVLGKGFVEAPTNTKVTFADFNYADKEDFENNSYTLNIVTEDNIIEALHRLLGTTGEEK